MSHPNQYPDPDDYFAHTRMGFGDHIEDLRRHLILAVAGFLVAMIGSFFISGPILAFITAPVISELQKLHDARQERMLEELKNDPKFKELAKDKIENQEFDLAPVLAAFGVNKQKSPKPDKNGHIWVKVPVRIEKGKTYDFVRMIAEKLGPRPTLKILRVEEGLMVFLKVAIMAGFVIAFPWIFYQIWAFIAAGLYPHEKRLIHVYLPFATGLFIAGIVFCQFIVIPRAVNALLMFNQWLGFEPDLRLSEWLGFAIIVPVVFGLSFQTPLVMLLLERMGITSIATYRKFRRYAIFIMAIASGVLTPTGDPVTMLFMLLPMCGFYELGIFLCKMAPGKPLLDLDIPDSDEMVEV